MVDFKLCSEMSKMNSFRHITSARETKNLTPQSFEIFGQFDSPGFAIQRKLISFFVFKIVIILITCNMTSRCLL